jgi:hypothetical protein
LIYPQGTFTFVFREDHTGYLLLDKNYYESFAYWDKTYRNIDGSNGQFLGMASDIKCFAYDTGFLSLEPEYTCTHRECATAVLRERYYHKYKKKVELLFFYGDKKCLFATSNKIIVTLIKR